VIFIEPDYFDSPARIRPPCDNHPPLSMAPGEQFLKEIYLTLTSHVQKWARTALFVTYDEHGGFWDHVPPAHIQYTNPNGVSFETTGPRIPVLACGPYAARGVCKKLLDNTSLLHLFAERFADGSYSDSVDARSKQGIASASTVLSVAAANNKVLQLPDVTIPPQPTPGGAPSVLGAMFMRAYRELIKAHGTEALKKYPMLGTL
jgi:phospholipase C